MLPLVSVTQPFAPLGRLQQLWARLTTHIPTEPTVTGGEHTTLGLSAAGALLFVSPWQVCCGAVSIKCSVQSSLDGIHEGALSALYPAHPWAALYESKHEECNIMFDRACMVVTESSVAAVRLICFTGQPAAVSY